jgi:hypothetical protein
MATKKKIAKKSAKNFVLRFHSNLSDPDIVHESPKFYSESGQGWVSDVGSATRYDSGGADKIMLELLKEEKVASELVDLNDAPQNLFHLHTTFLDDKCVPQVITKVPQFYGDTYFLVPSGVSWSEEYMANMLREEELEILWDSEEGCVPDDTYEWLKRMGLCE